jgi:hypothetical protein
MERSRNNYTGKLIRNLHFSKSEGEERESEREKERDREEI